MRLDLHVSKIYKISRNKSMEFIKNGYVFVNNECVKKPSFLVQEQEVQLQNESFYVSRAGSKLFGFLNSYNIDINDKICLDVGSSTGGFVQVLLQNGAKKVVAVDVGSEQLHVSLKENKNIQLYENTDIRKFYTNDKFDIITCDVSFISFKDICESLNRFEFEKIIILFKPQFEVGKDIKRTKKGVVSDEKAVQFAKENFINKTKSLGWKLEFTQNSLLCGKEGNVEIFYAFKKK